MNMEQGKVYLEMEVVGITYNQIESGIYAVVLKEKDGVRRIPIVIGESEAQAIECKLQDVQISRPLTHDLFINTLEAIGHSVAGGLIYLLPSGIFAAELYILCPDGSQIVVDSRASDAIAIAVRRDVPVFMDRELVYRIGFRTPGNETQEAGNEENIVKNIKDIPLEQKMMLPEFDMSSLSNAEMNEILEKALETEFYELAAKIKKEIDRRAQKS